MQAPLTSVAGTGRPRKFQSMRSSNSPTAPIIWVERQPTPHAEAWMTAVHPEDREIAANSLWEAVPLVANKPTKFEVGLYPFPAPIHFFTVRRCGSSSISPAHNVSGVGLPSIECSARLTTTLYSSSNPLFHTPHPPIEFHARQTTRWALLISCQ
jgi:hypothetical protein